MKPLKILITGITGQDGSYLAEMLLACGYEVHGIMRRSSSFHTERIDHIFDKLHLHYGDLTDAGAIYSVIGKIKPDMIFNLGAQSHVMVSFQQPAYTTDTIVNGTMNILEAVRHHRDLDPRYDPKIYQASSSEMFGNAGAPQNEHTPFKPQSPYAVAKVAAHHMAEFYRDAYGMFICSGILFNHESPRRGPTFVTQKIVKGLAALAAGGTAPLVLGSVWPMRDWGYAREYMSAAYALTQLSEPKTVVIGTGETHSVYDFIEECCAVSGLNLDYLKHAGMVQFNDPKYVRPAEVPVLEADIKRAFNLINWEPKTKMKQLAGLMMQHEMKKYELPAQSKN